MSATENIFGGVLIVMIFVVLFILMNKSTTEYVVSEYELKKTEHLSDLYANDFNTVLLITENTSNRAMSSLLADAIFYREEVLNFSGKSINVTEEFEDILDEVYGEGRYYLEIRPKIVDVSLNFVIDGSQSLQSEREKLAQELPGIISKVREKVNETGDEVVTADVFILEHKEQGNALCSIFPDDKYVHIEHQACSILDNTDIYNQLDYGPDNQTFDTNSTDYLKYSFNLTAPYENSSTIDSMRENGIKDYYGSDWGTGSAYVSIKRKGDAKLVLIFPMGDELSTSSISEECFDIAINNFENRARQKICDICTESCDAAEETDTELRSMKTVEKAVTVAQAHDHIINPIFAYNCDYEYKDVFNLQYESVNGVSTTNACDETGCGGCSGDTQNTCFHPECEDGILSQMQHLADETAGKVIDLEDIENLDYDIDDTIRANIEGYKFSVGTFHNTSRHSVKRSVPLPNKMAVDVKLFVFQENHEMRRG